jgi:hypothetical protein
MHISANMGVHPPLILSSPYHTGRPSIDTICTRRARLQHIAANLAGMTVLASLSRPSLLELVGLGTRSRTGRTLHCLVGAVQVARHRERSSRAVRGVV